MDARTKADWDAARPRISEVVPAACYAPFVSMFFTTTGDVVVCCESQSFPLGNVTKQSLDAIWHGKQYRRLRQALTAYELPASCSFCA